MLTKAHGSGNNLAWLVDERGSQALRCHQWSAAPDASSLSFYAPYFSTDQKPPWLLGQKEQLYPLQGISQPEVLARHEPSALDFARVHGEILSAVARRDFIKVVPIVIEELEFLQPLEPAMFPAAFEVRPQQFSYGFAFNSEGLLGITPELLFRVSDGILETMALAGTGPIDGPDLRRDEKECREHALVIDHIREALAGLGTMTVGDTVEKPYGLLKHLYTPIQLRLESIPSFDDLVRRLHPTAALGGWPRSAALKWLKNQEFHQRRRRFGAPFGWQEGEAMMCVVAIRCLQWKGRRAQLAAGCGVVTGSQSEREWKELQLKRQAVIKNLGLAL